MCRSVFTTLHPFVEQTLIRHRATYSLFIFFKLSDVISRFTLSLCCTDLTYKHSFIWSVYIYINVHAHAHTHIHTHTYKHTHTHTHTHMYLHLYIHICRVTPKKRELLKGIVAAMYSWQHCGTGTLSYRQPLDYCLLKGK